MTFLGKIFSVLVLIFSIIFWAISLVVVASHRNWQQVVMDPNTGLRVQVERVTQVNNELRSSKQEIASQLAREQAARRTTLSTLETQRTSLQSELSDETERVTALTLKSNTLATAADAATNELKRLTEENRSLKDQIVKERDSRDQLFAQTLELTDERNLLQGKLLQQLERNGQLLSEVTRYKEVVDANGINVNDPVDGAPPVRNGTIVAVDQPSQMVEISIGRDEGLRKGHFLDVSRGNRYLGKLKVVRSPEPDRAIAVILADYRVGNIQEGDRVDTTNQ